MNRLGTNINATHFKIILICLLSDQYRVNSEIGTTLQVALSIPGLLSADKVGLTLYRVNTTPTVNIWACSQLTKQGLHVNATPTSGWHPGGSQVTPHQPLCQESSVIIQLYD